MKAREIRNLGVPHGEPVRLAGEAVKAARRGGMSVKEVRAALRHVVREPEAFTEHVYFAELANKMVEHLRARASWRPREEPAPWRQWGDDLDAKSIRQLHNACQLPVSVRGALMPDAHVGYGLPIGGVLATRDAVIPYAVGVDIACRVRMSVYDVPPGLLDGEEERFKKAIERETRFGIGSCFRERRDHKVLDEDWSVSPVTRKVKDKAWAQLGTSGSGNHFVEFGVFQTDNEELGLEPGLYLALLTHSGSRGAGATVASYYSRLAMDQHPELPKELRHLAWLDLSSEEGQEYWAAMELMGQYAAANHACIHKHIARHLGAKVILDLENHHNFAWKEFHDGEELIVHRKGATPAGKGVLGIIPGSMATPTYVVRGLGNPDALESAAHGAGRVMSRTEARHTFRWKQVRPLLAERRVTLITADLDEVPMVYKNIDEVMAAQSDLVVPVASFLPRLVKMAPPGERPED